MLHRGVVSRAGVISRGVIAVRWVRFWNMWHTHPGSRMG